MTERLALSGEESEFEDFLILNPVGRERLVKKYKDNAFGQSFGWNWLAIPYNRVAMINHLIHRIGPDCRYLEIGCDLDVVFHSVPLANKVGVDPVSGGNRRMTSDQFFAENTDMFDLIFIDGLHTHDQLHRDVENALRVIRPGGFILLHDMLPRDWREEHVPRLHGFWTGDVWKVGFELATTPGLEFRVALIDHGVGVLKAPAKPVTAIVDMRPALATERFAYYHSNIDVLPKLTWDECLDWIAGQGTA